MPTATSTLTKAPFYSPLPLKAGLKPSTSSSVGPHPTPSSATTPHTSTTATLRSLYSRATRAFVLRDIPTTYSLLQSAFALLKPPSGSGPDSLSDYRRKWDILRITFESTVYASPPSPSESLPESLRAILAEAPQALATSIYTRSLTLFTPSNGISQKATLNAAFLPPQVLTTLVYCSIKLDAPDVGRIIIEDWIARREPHYSLDAQGPEENGYEKVLELYCLHILPKVEQWEYAKEFLEYESELPAHRREHLRASLNNLYSQTMASRRPFKPPPTSLPTSTLSSPRSYSPAPSSSSSSSSLSTTSTHTVVPATPRGPRSSDISSLTSLTKPSSSASVSSNETATPRAAQASLLPNGNHGRNLHHNNNNRAPRPQSKSRTLSSGSSAYSSLPRSHLAHQVSARPVAPSTYAVIQASLAPYLTSTKVTTFLVLFVLMPLISFILRMRRRKRLMGLGGAAGAAMASSSASNAELVRRRLQASGGVEGSLFKRAWGEVVRVVGDTVTMAGRGLV